MIDDSNPRRAGQTPVLGFRRFSPIALCHDVDGGAINDAVLSALAVAGRLYSPLRIDVDIERTSDAEPEVRVRSFDLELGQLGPCLDDVRSWIDEAQKSSPQWSISAALASAGWSRIVLPDSATVDGIRLSGPDGEVVDDLTCMKAPDFEGLQTRWLRAERAPWIDESGIQLTADGELELLLTVGFSGYYEQPDLERRVGGQPLGAWVEANRRLLASTLAALHDVGWRPD